MSFRQLKTKNLSFFHKLLVALLLLSSAFFLGLLADLPHIPILLFIGILPVFLQKRSFAFTDRSVIYAVLITLTVTVISAYLFPFERSRLGFFSFFFRPEYYSAFLLNIAAASCYFNSRKLSSALTISAVVFVLGSCGDVNNLNYINNRFIWGSDWINNNYLAAYKFMLTSQLLLTLLLLKIGEADKKERQQNFSGRLLYVCSLLFFLIIIKLLFVLHRAQEQNIRNLEQSFIAKGSYSLARHLIQQREYFFADQVDLNRPMPLNDLKRDKEVLIRVISNKAPDYLRCKVYTRYLQGQWKDREETAELALVIEESIGALASIKYRLQEPQEEANEKFDIFFTNKFHSDKLPVTAAFNEVEIVAESLGIDKDGQVSSNKWKKDAGYTVFNEKGSKRQTFNLPTDIEDEKYLQVPEDIKENLVKLLDEIKDFAEDDNDFNKMQAIALHLQNNYVYRLGPYKVEPELEFPRKRQRFAAMRKALSQRMHRKDIAYRPALLDSYEEPLLHFLEESKAGHCELFASSAVLLLRQAGIPARYVSGFICNELHPSKAYYVARLGHAHAWLEAYDKESKNWLMLDPTPADGRRDYQNAWSYKEAVLDKIKMLVTQILASIQRGLIAEAIWNALKLAWQLIYNPIGLTVIIINLTLILYYKQKYKQKELLQLNEKQKIWAKNYKKISRKWEKKLKLKKSKSRTARELFNLAKLNQKTSKNEIEELEKWLKNYEKERFSQN